MAYQDETSGDRDEIPFGAMELPPGYRPAQAPGAHRAESPGAPAAPGEGEGRKDWRRPENRRGSARRGGRRRWRQRQGEGEPQDGHEPDPERGGEPAQGADEREPREAPGGWTPRQGDGAAPGGEGGQAAQAQQGQDDPREGGRPGRRRRRRRGGSGGGQGAGTALAAEPQRQQPRPGALEARGMFVSQKGGFGFLRREENQLMPTRDDVFVPQHLVQRHKLRDGALVEGPAARGQGPNKLALQAVTRVDGRDPREVANLPQFKKLTSIDPDFHYAVGDSSGDVSMRIVDIVCPVGRGTRGLIVAPPRSGKTVLMRKFAKAIEEAYPDVVLMVLLVDERPEEATEWRRSTKGQVFVSTNDELAKHHVELAEAVYLRCQRLVELGQDVVLLLDSITRLARAYNNLEGGSGRTLSGGLDTRAMERPKALFGSARNTETAGSLTILGTTLVETGSRLDQVVFEEFKGTGNMELVLSRKLSDRRIFPAIDIERSGTRKEEKLISARRLKQIHILRRVLLKMNFIEAMELLVSKLEDVEKTDDFLKRFEVDPEA